MAKKTEGRHTGEYILSEAGGTRSRDNVKMASGAGVVEASTVLGKITASGKFVPHNPAATDGSEVAVAINYARVDATDADALCVATARDSEVKGSELIYSAGTDTKPEKDAVNAALAANGIVVR